MTTRGTDNMREYAAKQQRQQLTDEHREYLRANAKRDILLFDFLQGFVRTFNLTPEQAGKLLGAWIRETT